MGISPELGVRFYREMERLLREVSDNLLAPFRQECLLVVGTGPDQQTVVRFKLLQFVRPAKILADLVLNANNPGEWVPLHPSRVQLTAVQTEQLRAGVRIVQKKINDAIQ